MANSAILHQTVALCSFRPLFVDIHCFFQCAGCTIAIEQRLRTRKIHHHRYTLLFQRLFFAHRNVLVEKSEAPLFQHHMEYPRYFGSDLSGSRHVLSTERIDSK